MSGSSNSKQSAFKKLLTTTCETYKWHAPRRISKNWRSRPRKIISPLRFHFYVEFIQFSTTYKWANLDYLLVDKLEVVGLERCPLSLMSTTEELLDRKVAAPV
jgi:hypothetical protein